MNKYENLKEYIKGGKLFDFLAEEGHKFTKNELISLAKELIYTAETMSNHYNSGFDFSSFCEALDANIQENTSLYDEE